MRKNKKRIKNNISQMDNFQDTLIVIFGVIGLLLLYAVILAVPTMLLWDWLMPIIFQLPTITFWQALGLNVLSGILMKTNTAKQ